MTNTRASRLPQQSSLQCIYSLQKRPPNNNRLSPPVPLSPSAQRAVDTVDDVEEALTQAYKLLEYLYPLGLVPDSYLSLMTHLKSRRELKDEVIEHDQKKPLKGFPAEIISALKQPNS